MEDRLRSAGLEGIVKQRGESFIRQAEADHMLSEIHQSRPNWFWSLISLPIRGLAHLVQAHETTLKHERAPKAELQHGPRAIH